MTSAFVAAVVIAGTTLVATVAPAAAAVTGGVQTGVSIGSVTASVGPQTPLYTVDLEFTISNPAAVACPADLNFLVGDFLPERVDLLTTDTGGTSRPCAEGEVPDAEQHASTRVFKFGANGGDLVPGGQAPIWSEIRFGHTAATDARFQRDADRYITVPPKPVWVAIGDGYSSQLIQADAQDLCIDGVAECTGETLSWAEKALIEMNKKVSESWQMDFVSYATAEARLDNLVSQADQAAVNELLGAYEGSWNIVSLTGGLLDAGLSGLEAGLDADGVEVPVSSVLADYYAGPGAFGVAGQAESWYIEFPDATGGTYTVTVDAGAGPQTTTAIPFETEGTALFDALNALDLGLGDGVNNLNYASFVFGENAAGADLWSFQFAEALGALTSLTVDGAGLEPATVEPVATLLYPYVEGTGDGLAPWNLTGEDECPAYGTVPGLIDGWSAAQTSAMGDVVDVVTASDQNVTVVQLLYPRLGEASQTYTDLDGNEATFTNACSAEADAAIAALNQAIDLTGTDDRVHVLDLSGTTDAGGFGELTTGVLTADVELGLVERSEAYLQLTRPYGYPYPSDTGKNRAGEDAFTRLLLPLLGGDPPELWHEKPTPTIPGWYKDDVVVTWHAIDPDTGAIIEGFPYPSTESEEGSLPRQSPALYANVLDGACDDDGCTPRQSVLVSIDKTAPKIAAVPDRAPDAEDATGNQWYNAPVTVTWDFVHDWVGVPNPDKDDQVVNDASGFIGMPNWEDTFPRNGATNMYQLQYNDDPLCDRVGNCTTLGIQLNIDNQDPEADPFVVEDPAGIGTDEKPWYKGAVTVDWQTSDEGGSKLDADAAVQTTSETFTSDGIHTVVREVCDWADNCIESTIDVRIDQSGPVLDIGGFVGDVYLSQPDPNITCSATDAHSGVATSTCSTIRNSVEHSSTDGSILRTITFSSTDLAGNTTEETVTYRRFDDQPPEIRGFTARDTSEVTPDAASGWFNQDVDVDWDYHDNPEDGVNRLLSFPERIAAEEGINTYEGTVTDLAGNEATDSVEVKLDTKAPNARATANGGALDEAAEGETLVTKWFNVPVTVEWTAFGDHEESGVDVSGVDPTRASTSETFADEGIHTAVNPDGTLCDVADNCATSSVEVRIDLTAPTVTPSVDSDKVGAWYNGAESVMVSWLAADEEGGSGLLDEPLEPLDAIQVVGEGKHAVTIPKAGDVAGNVSEGGSLDIWIDVTAPTITGHGYDPDTAYAPDEVPDPADITCTADDTKLDESGQPVNIEVSGVEGDECIVSSAPRLEPGPEDEPGTMYFVYTATATDRAGNVGTTTLKVKVTAEHVGGRMTGGGTLPDDVHASFTLRCNGSPNQLTVTGGGVVFTLTEMYTTACWLDTRYDAEGPPAELNTYVGHGVGVLGDGTEATIRFTFIDNGEPGTKDLGTLEVHYRRHGTDRVLRTSGAVAKGGNFQAEDAQGDGTNDNGDLNDPGKASSAGTIQAARKD